MRLKDIKWWFFHRFHPSHQYHIIRTGLRPGYYDPEDRILFGVMNIAKEFIEGVCINWDSDEGHEQAYKELKEAVDWFYIQRPEYEEQLNANYNYISEVEIEERNKEALHKVINNLNYLWYP